MLKLFRRTYHNKRDAEIEIFFKHVNWYKLLHVWGLFSTFIEARETIYLLKREQERIKQVWHDNPLDSLAQVLASMNLLPMRKITKGNSNSDWYFSSIEDLMVLMDIPECEHKLWVSIYNIFNIKRKYPKVILIKDMSTWHIKRILKFKKLTISYRFRRYFQEELVRRGYKYALGNVSRNH